MYGDVKLSVVEHSLDKRKVAGSTPATSIFLSRVQIFKWVDLRNVIAFRAVSLGSSPRFRSNDYRN